jgi:hypothetical protein
MKTGERAGEQKLKIWISPTLAVKHGVLFIDKIVGRFQLQKIMLFHLIK